MKTARECCGCVRAIAGLLKLDRERKQAIRYAQTACQSEQPA